MKRSLMFLNKDQCWSMLINADQYGSILLKLAFVFLRSILDQCKRFDRHIDPHWSAFHIDPSCPGMNRSEFWLEYPYSNLCFTFAMRYRQKRDLKKKKKNDYFLSTWLDRTDHLDRLYHVCLWRNITKVWEKSTISVMSGLKATTLLTLQVNQN